MSPLKQIRMPKNAIPPAIEFGSYADSVIAEARNAGVPQNILLSAQAFAGDAERDLSYHFGRVYQPGAGPRKKNLTELIAFGVLIENRLYPRPPQKRRREKAANALMHRQPEAHIEAKGGMAFTVSRGDGHYLVSFAARGKIGSLAACRDQAVDYVQWSNDGKHGIAIELLDPKTKRITEPRVEIHCLGSEGFERVRVRAWNQAIADPLVSGELVRRGVLGA